MSLKRDDAQCFVKRISFYEFTKGKDECEREQKDRRKGGGSEMGVRQEEGGKKEGSERKSERVMEGGTENSQSSGRAGGRADGRAGGRAGGRESGRAERRRKQEGRKIEDWM